MSDEIREAERIADQLQQLIEDMGEDGYHGSEVCIQAHDLLRKLNALAQQSAPVAVPDGLRRDEAYRNGLMAGFGFGLKGDEAGYATALAGYSREIHEARAILAAAPAAPVALGQEPVAWLIDPGMGSASDRVHLRPPSAFELDAIKAREGSVKPLYTAPPAAEQSYSTTSDQYRAELYDEVWAQARLIGYGNVTEALADLERRKAAERERIEREQPDTVKVDHRDIAELMLSIGWKDSSDAQWDRLRNAIPELRALLAGGDKP